MTDTTAQIRAKGLDSTGVTEQLAAKMYNNVGGHYLAIVDLRVAFHGEDDDGNKRVQLVIDQVEPVVDGKLNGALVDHVREINAALHRNRMLAENGPTLPLDGESTSSVEEVLAAGPALIDHDDEGPKLSDADDWEYPGPEGDKDTPPPRDVDTVDDPFLARDQEPAAT